MKKLLFISITVFLTNIVSSQILTQDFEGTTFPPTGWEATITNSGEGFHWTPNTITPLQGLKDVSVVYDPDLVPQNETLTSPSFSLVGYSSAILTFDVLLSYFWAVSPNENYDVTVSISTDSGFSWIPLWTEADQGVFTSFTKLSITENLTAYVGNPQVKIKINYDGVDGAQAKFDNVVITGLLKTTTFFDQNFSLYPNPVRSIINLNSKNGATINNIQITDLNGRIVKEVSPSNVSETQINVSDLNSGVYFVKAQTENGVGTTKIVKQ